MDSIKPVLAVVSNNMFLNQIIETECSSYPVQIKKFSDADSFHAWVAGKKLNGVIIDFPCAAKASANTREFLNTIQKYLPICRLRIDPKTSTVFGQVQLEFLQGPELFKKFFEKLLLPDAGRQVRKNERI